MSSLSIKGIVVGVLFDWGASLAFSIGLGIFLALSTEGDALAATQVANSGGWLLLATIVGGAFTVAAGYLAARIAGRGELVNGGACALVSMVIGLVLSMGQPAYTSEIWTILLCVVTPLLGVLGGYLRLRQVGEPSAA